MLIYILKFSVCLAVFMIFYKLFLEKESMHQFKRIYLLIGIAIALGIPFITFTEYVVTSSEFQPVIINDLALNTNTNSDYLSIVLWSIYGLGVLIFGILFFKNLINILSKINRNTRVKNNHFTNVLLQNLVIPHTFFNYIFLNKHKFETQQIPKEVLLHEETHAIQKHSLDILFIELLQVIFWFNPLLNFIKKDIKLNHEFLADQAVLNNGFDTSTYQNTLLTFSSNALHPQLANAINYSLIKKRFTVMKTHTSKKGIWFRGILLLPILAILLFSFSTKVIVLEEKNDIVEFEKIIQQEKATPEQIKEYNAIVKKLNSQPENRRIIKQKDVERIKYIYSLMSAEQKKGAEPFPKLAPPPPKVVGVVEVSTPEVIEVVEIPPAAIASKVIEVIEIPSNASEAPKVLVVREIPPPPPLPDNATPDEKKKYKEAIKDYKLKTQKVKLQKAKEGKLIKVRELRAADNQKQLQEGKLAYRKAQVAARANKIKTQKGELVKLREVRSVENRKKLQTEKRAYKETQVAARALKLKAQKGELVKVRELRAAEDRKQLQEGKLAYKKAQVAARANKIKAEKGELVKVRKLQANEERKQLQEGKLAYRKAQIAARTNKIKAEKEELVKVRELRTADDRKRLEQEKLNYRDAKRNSSSSRIELINNMVNKGAIFYFNGKEIPSKKAIQLAKSKRRINISTNGKNSKQPKVYLSTKPVVKED